MYPPEIVALGIVSSIGWITVYTYIIKLGFKEKTYGMPIFALCLNLSWEFLFSIVYPSIDVVQEITNIVWLALDVVILVTYLRYGRRYFPRDLNKNLFMPHLILVFGTSFLGIWLFSIEFNSLDGAYAAFLQNLIMSVLFIDMMFKRDGIEGQSVKIAIAKTIGTLAPTIGTFLYFPDSILLHFLGIMCFIFDVIYIYLLYRKFEKLGIDPYTRQPR